MRPFGALSSAASAISSAASMRSGDADHHGRRDRADWGAADLRHDRHVRAGGAGADFDSDPPGVALGGEYGGAAVYVAEHVPDGRRGFYTSFIQITATLGLFLSLAVILIIQNLMSPEAFRSWGWRIPFLISILLVAVSLYIRLRMKESPIFQHIKGTGATSTKPLREAFTRWSNLRIVLISLFGATAGQGVVWYTGQFYALFYLQTVLKVNNTSANYIVATALLLGMPLFVVFGALSDRIGRKRLMMAGCLLAAISYLPIYKAMQVASGSGVVTAVSQRSPVTGAVSLTPQTMVDGVLRPAAEVLPFAGVGALLSNGTAWQLILLVFIQVVFVTMVYGPIAAYCRSLPRRLIHRVALPYTSHWRVRGPAARHGLTIVGDRQHLRGTVSRSPSRR